MARLHPTKKIKLEKNSPIRKVYREDIDENGHLSLIEDGEYNESEEINSYYDSVKLDKILERIAYGDTSILRPSSTLQYGDVDLPRDPFEVIALKKESERKFNELPDEIKAIYNNDISAFASDLVSKGIYEIARKYNETRKSDVGTDTASNS